MYVARGKNPGEVFFVEIYGNAGNDSSQIIQQKIMAEGQAPVENPETSCPVGEILKTSFTK